MDGTDGTYELRPARYAKGLKAISCPSTSGWKTRAGRLAARLANGRWTKREKAYIMTPKAAERFEKLFAEGWDAFPMTGGLEAPPRTGDSHA